jgi:predicted 3-demethylubiquinone-9 3-methyltransferase (glyoxalase superfamily)
MQNKISTFLWFESNAAEAAALYCSIFSHGKITSSSSQSTTFELGGQRFFAFNGGPHFKLTPAVSLFVTCHTQDEIDTLWSRFLEAGGTESRCGWLVDKFGLSWQIIPTQLVELMNDPDPVKANRVVQRMLGMNKLDIAALERAHRGE